jgi:myo-inositol-1(or 4)-monophosphatase
MMDLEKLCLDAIGVVDLAAKFIKENRDKVASDQVIEKGKNSLVSYVDQGAEKILVNGFKNLIPSSSFITEEETIKQSFGSLTWIIDPLDGTTNFLHSLPYFSVSVALYDGNELLIGIVHEVIGNEVFHAIKAQGAYLNGKRIFVTKRQDFSDILIGTGFPYQTQHFTDAHMSVMKKVLMKTRGIRRIGSAAIDLCYVACGRFGAFYETNLNNYDIAAGGLIVKEAGGIVTTINGKDDWLEKGEIVATAPQFKAEMMDILNDFE